MRRRISLALILHNHQPIGNFGWVVAEAYEQAYRPMVDALERHPSVRVALHYSGPLLEWLVAEQPSFVERVRELVERRQVEVLGGGLYEPVLASLPLRDRAAQLTRMADAVEAAFGTRPAGAWLPERVWEPDVPASLAPAGYRWTVLDDAHFRAASIPEDALWGPYVTDDQGHALTVFGTEQGLRYRIPFHEVEDVIEYLREHATEAGDRLGTMGDDGEKFGVWPGTFQHSWGPNGWVERFFAALESNASWLSTVRPADWLAEHQPIGRVAIPTGSYAEMGEWALPPDESRAFHTALEAARAAGAPEARWLRGASWRGFQVKYREINDLHKQMLRASAKANALPRGWNREAALDHVYRGQSNDCYWHGLFGGIYLPHMRSATLANLIRAEDLADAPAGATGAEVADVDLDGRVEIRLASEGQVVLVKPDEGGGIGSWDVRASAHPLASVMRRRPEAYHEALREHEAARRGRKRRGTAPASIHEGIRVREPGLAGHLTYDEYERRSGLIRVLPVTVTAQTWGAGGRGDLGDFVDGPFEVDRVGDDVVRLARLGTVRAASGELPVRATVELRLGGGRLDPTLRQRATLENRGEAALEARVGVEWALTMLGGGGNPQAWWGLGRRRVRHDTAGSAEGITSIAQGNDWLGLALETRVSPRADAWFAPIETVSNSDAGFERVYQGSALLLSWVVSIAPGASWAATVTHTASATERAVS